MSERVWSALVVDDFPDAAEALAAWLTLEGWTVEVVNTADDALARVEARTPDVVIVEPYLREGSGMAVAALIRNRVGQRVTMIAVTGHPRVGDATAYEPTLFNITLIKPVDEAALRMALADAVARHMSRE